MTSSTGSSRRKDPEDDADEVARGLEAGARGGGVPPGVRGVEAPTRGGSVGRPRVPPDGGPSGGLGSPPGGWLGAPPGVGLDAPPGGGCGPPGGGPTGRPGVPPGGDPGGGPDTGEAPGGGGRQGGGTARPRWPWSSWASSPLPVPRGCAADERAVHGDEVKIGSPRPAPVARSVRRSDMTPTSRWPSHDQPVVARSGTQGGW